MSQDVPASEAIARDRVLLPVVLAGVMGLALAGTVALWVHYGTAVFFEMVRTGFMACFG